MSMTEETETKVPPAPKKKAKKPAARRGAPSAPKQEKADPYAGMTAQECCAGCNRAACAISHEAYCAHPYKGGLHPHQMDDADALARASAAKKKLRNQKIEVS